MKLRSIISLLTLAVGLPVFAQTTCLPPGQAPPNFSGGGTGISPNPVGSFLIPAGTTLPVNWTPSPTPGCTTYYTTNGQAPTTSSAVYTGQTLQLSQTTVILMIAEGTGFTPSIQEGGQWVIVVTGGTTPTAGPVVNLSCTPTIIPSGTVVNTNTVTMMRSIGVGATNFTQLVAGLPPACTYADSNVSAGNTYNYEAAAVVNGISSASGATPQYSNVVTISIAQAALTTPTVTLTLVPTTTSSGSAIVATITVASTGTPTPTGTVILTSGAFKSTVATLATGTASITIPANSLDVGIISLTAAYTPDSSSSAVYNLSSGTASVTIMPTSPTSLAGTVTQ